MQKKKKKKMSLACNWMKGSYYYPFDWKDVYLHVLNKKAYFNCNDVLFHFYFLELLFQCHITFLNE